MTALFGFLVDKGRTEYPFAYKMTIIVPPAKRHLHVNGVSLVGR